VLDVPITIVILDQLINGIASSQKKGEVDLNFIIFTKHQKRCFRNRYFELLREVGGYLPVNATCCKKRFGLIFLSSSA
jgi:hypothetical protein